MTIESIPQTEIPESDILPHIEDTPELVNAIRNGRLVQVSWNELTDDEQRAARAVIFDLRCEGEWY